MKIPYPFRKGDIIKISKKFYYDAEPDTFVVDELKDFDNVEYSNLYYVHEDDGEVCSICDDNLFEYEYYKGKNKSLLKLLYNLSDFVKGKIKLDMFMERYEENKFYYKKER